MQVFLGLLVLYQLHSTVASSLCQCSTVINSENHHLHFRNQKVEYVKADVAGEEFMRTEVPSAKHKARPAVSEENNDPLCDAEQIHINLGGVDYGSVMFSYVSTNTNITTPSLVYVSQVKEALAQNFDVLSGDQRVTLSKGSSTAFSENIYVHNFVYQPPMGAPMITPQEIVAMENTADFAYDHKTGDKWYYYRNVTKPENDQTAYNNPHTYYDSPLIHTTSLNGLQSGVVYYYRVSGSCIVYHFVVPAPQQYPLTIGLTGDLGQTEVSQKSLLALDTLRPDFALLVGDLSYADGYVSLWDTFGKMVEPFAAQTPILTTGGNHEFSFGENAVSYKTRWPTPHEGTGSANICYWGREVGVVHIIALCAYAGFESGSLQYIWLQKYLASKIDRTRTPWVVAMMHSPLYNSNTGHWMEGELMRRAVEPLLYRYGVDVVLCGHVHSYERTYPVFNNSVDECGITYLNLGDGGNFESTSGQWRFENGAAPSWTAFRENSFGIGALTILDANTANYSWHRHACGSSNAADYHMNFSEYCSSPGDLSDQYMLTSDNVLLSRPSKSACPNKYLSSASSDTDSSLTPTETAIFTLSVSVGVLTALLIGLSVKLYYQYRTYSMLMTDSKSSLRYSLLDNVVINEEGGEAVA
jgi:UDP-2,3-diacylglucosamine pyrophosphatase LpxH